MTKQKLLRVENCELSRTGPGPASTVCLPKRTAVIKLRFHLCTRAPPTMPTWRRTLCLRLFKMICELHCAFTTLLRVLLFGLVANKFSGVGSRRQIGAPCANTAFAYMSASSPVILWLTVRAHIAYYGQFWGKFVWLYNRTTSDNVCSTKDAKIGRQVLLLSANKACFRAPVLNMKKNSFVSEKCNHERKKWQQCQSFFRVLGTLTLFIFGLRSYLWQLEYTVIWLAATQRNPKP